MLFLDYFLYLALLLVLLINRKLMNSYYENSAKVIFNDRKNTDVNNTPKSEQNQNENQFNATTNTISSDNGIK